MYNNKSNQQIKPAKSKCSNMLIPLDDIILIYEQMLQQLNIDYVSVIIYTSIHIDSLCSLKILSKFLKSENIQYKVYPVTTYTELEQRIQDSKQYEKVRLFMFLNCGGLIDLSEKWFAFDRSHVEASARKVILFDVNKPIHHKNIESDNILIIDDKHSGLDDRITSKELEKLQQLNEIGIEDDIQSQQQKEIQGLSPKRRPRTQLSQRLKKHKQLIQQKYANYYSTTFYSLPTSYCLYQLIRELNKQNNYMLWYAIVGMTSMYLEGNISRQVLQKITASYRSDMVRFNSNPNNLEKREKGQIFTKKAYQFPLMNHWTLYDSMMNSSYLMTKLSLWNDKGVLKLHQILTKIGISLEQSKQQYKYMFKDMKQSLQQRLFAAAEDYNLVDITYESFMCQVDNSSAYMASDYYYLITAVLEKPIHKSTFSQLSQHRLDCFWSAYSLLGGSQEMIKRGLEEYKEMSTIIMKEIKDIIQRDSVIIINSKLSYSNIKCDTKEKRLLQHPNILIRLANMLMGIQRQRKIASSKKSVAPIPCLVSLVDHDKNVSLIVGVVPEQKNDMGNRFNVAFQKLKIPITHDSFMSNIIIVPKDNMIDFVKEVGNLKI